MYYERAVERCLMLVFVPATALVAISALSILVPRLAEAPQSGSTPTPTPQPVASSQPAATAGWGGAESLLLIFGGLLLAVVLVLSVGHRIRSRSPRQGEAGWAVNANRLRALASVLGSTALTDGVLTLTAERERGFNRSVAHLDRRALRRRPELAVEAWALMWASAVSDTVRETILVDASHAKRAARVDVDAVTGYLTDALERRHIDRDVTVTLEPRTTRKGDVSARAGFAYLAATFAAAHALMLDTALDAGHRTLAVTVPAGSDFPTVARFVALIDRATRNGLIRQAGSDYDTLRAAIDPKTVTDLPELPDGAAVLDALGERVEAGWTITGEEAETLGAPIPAPKRTPEPLTWFTPTYETRAAGAAAR